MYNWSTKHNNLSSLNNCCNNVNNVNNVNVQSEISSLNIFQTCIRYAQICCTVRCVTAASLYPQPKFYSCIFHKSDRGWLAVDFYHFCFNSEKYLELVQPISLPILFHDRQRNGWIGWRRLEALLSIVRLLIDPDMGKKRVA